MPYHIQTTLSSERRYPGPGNVFSTVSADNKTRNYDTEGSNHHLSLSTLKLKGLSRSMIKW